MAHANARLTPAGRLILVRRIASGRPAAHVAAEMGVSRTTAYRWWARWPELGQAGLVDRPSTAHTHPRRLPAEVEQAIAGLRQARKLGPARIAAVLGLASSTVHRVLCRLGLNRLAFMDRPTGRVIRRYERAEPASCSTWTSRSSAGCAPAAATGCTAATPPSTAPATGPAGLATTTTTSTPPWTTTPGWPTSRSYPTSGVGTCAGFLRRAGAFHAAHGVAIRRVLTDNARNYRVTHDFRQAVAELGAEQRFTRPYRPQSNGKVERFNRTMLDEWAYQRPYASNQERTAALDAWGCTCTTITAPTPRSAATRRSLASTTLRGSTSSPPWSCRRIRGE
jgi:transposase InsO family protein